MTSEAAAGLDSRECASPERALVTPARRPDFSGTWVKVCPVGQRPVDVQKGAECQGIVGPPPPYRKEVHSVESLVDWDPSIREPIVFLFFFFGKGEGKAVAAAPQIVGPCPLESRSGASKFCRWGIFTSVTRH